MNTSTMQEASDRTKEEVPERKKLKSTYKPSPGLATPLPAGWTEHTAPSGHKYYYNSQSKKSTYTRPVADLLPSPVLVAAPPPYNPVAAPSPYNPVAAPSPYNPVAPQSYTPSTPIDYAALAQSLTNGNVQLGATPYTVPPVPYQSHHFDRKPFNNNYQRPQPEDRPKKKAIIPNFAPWILVYTKLGRRFVHNTDTNESFWKFPPHVMTAVIEFDKLELEKKLAAKDTNDEATGANNVPVAQNNRHTRRRRSESLQREDEAALAAAEKEEDGKVVPYNPSPTADNDADDSSEYEEIEVTDDEDEENPNPNHPLTEEPSGPVEFGEDDIAYQLAQMGADYGLDPGDYDNPDSNIPLSPGAEGLPLTDADAEALFHDLLDDFNPSPFTPYDALLEHLNGIISDDRYTILPTTKARQAAHATWSRARIASLKLARSQMELEDPRIPYLAFLATNASPKLYWPEFKRKFKREDAMRDASRPVSFLDKDREKLYREHISRLKLPVQQRRDDLKALLAAQPLSKLNRQTSIATLPKEVLRDVRYISLPSGERDALVEAWVTTLAAAPTDLEAEEEDEEARAEREKKRRREREKREGAMRERERRVEEEKRRVEREVRAGKGRLRENERELEEASKVGREGLRAQIGGFDERDGGVGEE